MSERGDYKWACFYLIAMVGLRYVSAFRAELKSGFISYPQKKRIKCNFLSTSWAYHPLYMH